MHRALKAALGAALAALAVVPSAEAARVVPKQVIVKWAPGSAGAEAKGLAGAVAGVTRTVGRVRGVGAQVVRVAGDAKAAAARLNELPGVLYAEPDVILRTQSIPDDPRFGELYGIHNANDADIDGPEGWDQAFGHDVFPSSGVRVGIIDTGIDTGHDDLAGKTVACAGVRSFGFLGLFGVDPTIVNGRCVDDNDHGTHVAGTVGALTDNGIGVAGVAPPAQFVICKALNSAGSGPVSGIANCINWVASQNVRVISMSLGGASSTTMQQAVRNAWNGGNGDVIVAAAGNAGNTSTSYPAGYAEVVSVAATDRNDQRASFSQQNADVEVAAAGVDVLSTVPGDGYAAFSGTSMATPHVAGVAAVVAHEHPSLNAAGIRSRIASAATTDDLGAPGRDPAFGWGRANLVKALQ